MIKSLPLRMGRKRCSGAAAWARPRTRARPGNSRTWAAAATAAMFSAACSPQRSRPCSAPPSPRAGRPSGILSAETESPAISPSTSMSTDGPESPAMPAAAPSGKSLWDNVPHITVRGASASSPYCPNAVERYGCAGNPVNSGIRRTAYLFPMPLRTWHDMDEVNTEVTYGLGVVPGQARHVTRRHSRRQMTFFRQEKGRRQMRLVSDEGARRRGFPDYCIPSPGLPTHFHGQGHDKSVDETGHSCFWHSSVPP